ncbi:hypothetical protein EJB05_20230 [Eragrostis curvula]|uniref:Uncharacterized protein n=1 Tax=Eragrostis curvula TaxID=38414 RepID=A0A5J9V065_9POAL|nr:hypothetical protein EJB05_20230 [Eragrostis curvula]
MQGGEGRRGGEMVRSGEKRHFFPLTSLQIGSILIDMHIDEMVLHCANHFAISIPSLSFRDLQSYLAELTIFLCPDTKKFLILLDNRPWLVDQDTKPAHLWQLMVTKSRFSPFANTKSRRKRNETGGDVVLPERVSAPHLLNKSSRWYSVIDEAVREKKLQVNKLKDSRILNRELHQTLYGFIIFEVDWADVRGINYLNELQTDTSMAVESKIMKRWEFESVNQALESIRIWFSGNGSERKLLQNYLNCISSNDDEFYDARKDFLPSEWDSENLTSDNDDSGYVQCIMESSSLTGSSFTQPPCAGPYKRRKITKSDDGSMPEESYSEVVISPRYSSSPCSSCGSDSECDQQVVEPCTYKDVLICFRFNDHDLPFRLKEVILPDVRLLTLLEYGLPSWVIFLQSYPVFCKIYRPWMCPLARALYVLMSIITVLIGFYDLYKNVPMLKATASRLFGPLFDWIETWEMITRLKYLGTMLFLHNFQQAFTWSLKIVNAAKSALSVLTKPILGPLLEVFEFTLPIWNLFAETVGYLSSVVMVSLETSWSVVISTMQMIIWPIWFVFSTVLNIVNSVVYPVVWLLWEVLAAPFHLVVWLVNFVAEIFVDVVSVLKQTWSTLSALSQVGSLPQSSGFSSESSIWGSLWKDLLYQIFRAIRSILYGFVAFFSTCNRHRLREGKLKLDSIGVGKLALAIMKLIQRKLSKGENESNVYGDRTISSRDGILLGWGFHTNIALEESCTGP